MKKLFILIALAGACIPAVQGMEASLPADVQKKYDHLVALIKNVDVEGFKSAFDALTLPAKDIAALRKIVFDAKTAVNKEIKTLGNKNKGWAKIAQDALAGVYGLPDPAAILDVQALPSESIDALQQVALDAKTDVARKLEAMGDNNKDWAQITKGALSAVYGVSNIIAACAMAYSLSIGTPPIFVAPFCMPAIIPWAPLLYAHSKLEWGYYSSREGIRYLVVGVLPFIAYKTIPYGIKTFKAGLNYRQHLQDQLTNLDAIAAHIAGAKTQAA